MAFLAPPFLAVGGPSRSSILLALLILVVGRLGGPLGGPVALPLDMDLLIGAATEGGTARAGGPADCPNVLLVAMAETDR